MQQRGDVIKVLRQEVQPVARTHGRGKHQALKASCLGISWAVGSHGDMCPECVAKGKIPGP